MTLTLTLMIILYVEQSQLGQVLDKLDGPLHPAAADGRKVVGDEKNSAHHLASCYCLNNIQYLPHHTPLVKSRFSDSTHFVLFLLLLSLR